MIQPGLEDKLSSINYEPPKTIASKFVDQISQVSDEGIKKIVLDDPAALAQMGGDAAAMMQQMMATQPGTAELPPEAAALMQQMMAAQKVEANPDAGMDVIRKRPEYLEKAMKQVSAKNQFELDVDMCSVLNLYVNTSNRKNVVNRMESLSKIKYNEENKDTIYYYSDIGINFYFDEYDVVNEIEIDEKYKHQTTKGLKINDPIEKAVELYGPPRMKSAKGAIWNRFSVLLHERTNEIKTIRLKLRA